MNLKVSAGLLALAALAATALFHDRSSLAQVASPVAEAPAVAADEPFDAPRAAAPSAGPPHAVYTTPVPADSEPDPFGPAMASRQPQPSLREAAAAVRSAQDDEAREAASQRLHELLNKTFDADMERREEELAKIEQRLQALREQAARRLEKKDEIIELQTRVLINEADGLGFYSSDEPMFLYSRAATAEPMQARGLPSPDYLRPAYPNVPGRAPNNTAPRPGADAAPAAR
jgi:hypothetical protein